MASSSSSSSLAAAMQAFVDEDYAAAEENYTAALAAEQQKTAGRGENASPEKIAELLAGRAAARLSLEDFLGAADDARRAVAASPGLSKAHVRRGIALFHLDELESSLDALRTAVDLLEEQQKEGTAGKGGGSGGGSGGGNAAAASSARKWLKKAEEALAAEGAPPPPRSQAASAAATAAPEEKEATGGVAAAARPAEAVEEEEAAPPSPSPPPPPPPPPQQKQQPRFRHQWFQTGDAVEVGILAKGIKKEAVRVEFGPRSLRVLIDEGGKETASSSPAPPFSLDLALAGAVVPEECRYSVLSTKVEIRLRKAVPGVSWPSLEEEKGTASEGEKKKEEAAAAAASAVVAAAADKSSSSSAKRGPSYPTSNPKRTNWDELDKKLEQEEQEEEGAGPAEEGEEALLKLFRSVYSGGDDDVRRAMSKSFVESGGEALSTSWSDVSVGKMPGDDECFDEGCGGSCGHRHHHHSGGEQ